MKVTEPGWHDGISSADYHSAGICDGPSISASGLKKIALDCPAIYWTDSPFNPNREEQRSEALDFGKAAHALMLGEPQFDAEFVVSPYDDFRKKDAQQWREEQTRVVVTADQLETIRRMVRELRASPQTANAFRHGTPERSFFTRDAETGIWLKARPDWFPDKPAQQFIQEYKTAISVRPDRFGMAAFDFGYDIQAALMVDVVSAVLGERVLGIAHIVQMKTPPYLADFQYFSEAHLERGRRLYRAALRIFAECWERHLSGKPERIAWPGYRDAPAPILTPYRVARELEEGMSA